MARVGASQYYQSSIGPAQRDRYWREAVARTYWDHPFHPLREDVAKPGYRDARATSAETLSGPWKLLRESHEVGKDDLGASYLNGRLRPSSSAGALGASGPAFRPGEASMAVTSGGRSRLQRSLRSTSSSALGLSAKLPAAKVEDLGDPGRLRTPASRAVTPGGYSAAAGVPSMAPGSRHRMPSFTRVLNV
mmetsp:Transcript_97840/g.315768  ORF Transcript_97840/g.315768 Transcript_97840/m.315768 type:complete len:191 (+) Transcript_97840:19-591(+)